MIEYNTIFERIQDKLNRGEITFKLANEANNLAYEKYAESKSNREFAKDIPNDIKEFYDSIKSFEYGVIHNGKPITNLSSFDFWNDYKSLTISEFEKYKTGVCWDFVHYEAKWFNEHGYKYETYYIETVDHDGDYPSHTFLLFYLPDDSNVYYFELSWGKYRGIEIFKNKNEAINTIKKRHANDARVNNISNTLDNKYDAKSNSFEKLSCGDFMIKASGNKTNLLKN